jgi:hypothetical protein
MCSLRCVSVVLALLIGSVPGLAADRVDFVAEVQPILAQNCYECHGNFSREGGLRLTNAEDAFRPGDFGIPVISSGDAELSPLMDLLVAEDPDERMPQKGDPLTTAEIDTIRRWIDQGAIWPAEAGFSETHWAYRAPKRPQIPAGADARSGADVLDAFVQSRLAREGIASAGRGRPESLVRRLHFDLIGLPPEPATVRTFAADPSEAAWEVLVGRLLASPQFGEHWATQWLDLARYADSTGFMAERVISNWPYRDWVVEAINRDLPFDQFSIEQLAGDLLEEPTVAQRVATGFHRSAPLNLEAGVREEEARVQQVLDNVNTTGTVWMASTVACAQCHDHKFDPISQKEYFQLYSFFNGARAGVRSLDGEGGVALLPGGAHLLLAAPGSEAIHEQVWQEFRQGFEALDISGGTRFTGSPELAAKLAEFRQTGDSWQFRNQLLVVSSEAALAELTRRRDADWFETWLSHVAPRIDAMENSYADLQVSSEAADAAVGTDAAAAVSCVKVVGEPETLTDAGFDLVFPAGTWTAIRMEINPPSKRPGSLLLAEVSLELPEEPGGSLLGRARVSAPAARYLNPAVLIDGNPSTHWRVKSWKAWQDHSIMLSLAEPLTTRAGETLSLRWRFRALRPAEPHKICFSATDAAADLLVLSESNREALSEGKWRSLNEDQKRRVQTEVAVTHFPRLAALLAKAERQVARAPTFGKALVMEESEDVRVARIFERGDPHILGAEVVSDTPASLHPFPPDAPRNRLGFARWLVAEENPLAARVAVNRWWGQIFGAPIVTTPEDFGIRGARPTHPELLDWLAIELVASNWSRKEMIRQMVLSETYRRSLQPASPEVLERDPENRLLARSSHRRLSAEAIRDNALKISGLLVATMGGPAVHPPQPRGVVLRNGLVFEPYIPSLGADVYRRGLYTAWRRSAPPPNAMTFGASERTACRMTRSEMNTPLQALVLLNDDVFSEAALAFAERILDETPGESDADRLEFSFFAALSRAPDERERETLLDFLEQRRLQLTASPGEAEALLKQPRRPRRDDLPATELASWFGVARVLLNLDEVIHRG